MSAMDTAVNAVETWAVVAGVCLLLLAFFYLLGVLIDIWLDRHRNHDLDEVLRHDRAREAMRKWTDEPVETTWMLNRALNREGEVVTFTRDEDGVLHEDE